MPEPNCMNCKYQNTAWNSFPCYNCGQVFNEVGAKNYFEEGESGKDGKEK